MQHQVQSERNVVQPREIVQPEHTHLSPINLKGVPHCRPLLTGPCFKIVETWRWRDGGLGT